MNKTEIAMKVSQRSGVDFEDCKKVLNAFEEVLSDELANSKGLGGAFDKLYRVMGFFKDKKDDGTVS